MVPIKREGKKLFIGMVNPFDDALVARLKEKLSCPLEVSYLTETNYSQVVSYLFVNE